MWSSSTSAIKPLMPPRTAASSIRISAQSWSSTLSLRSTDSICPRIRFIRFRSFVFSRSVWLIFPPYTLLGYTTKNQRYARQKGGVSHDERHHADTVSQLQE